MQTLDPLTFPLTGLSLIEASAGTGKTYTITSLYLRLLIEKNYTVEQILLVTFTKASTEELRERIHTRLYNAKQDILLGASNDLLIQHFLLNQSDRQTMLDTLNTALICLDEVSIFTIHGFCQRVLQEHAFESGSNFDSELIQDETELKQTIIEDYWRQHFYQFPTPLIPWIQKHWSQPSDLLSEINNHLGKFQLTIIPDCQYDSFAMYQQHILSTSMQLKQVWSDHQAEIIEILTEHKSIKRTSYRKDYLAKWISELTQFLQEDLLCLPKNFDRFTQSSIDKATKANAPSVNHTFFKYCEQLQELLTELAIFTHRHCLNFVNHQCQSRKQNDSLLSFDDLLKQLHDALHQPNNSYLSDKIRQQYPIAMIDEFQDTDPLQYQIFNKIYDGQAESGLFMIGDPKQAIYSFRGADIFTYMEARQKPNNQQGQYTLKTNWRSTHAMVSAVNTLFESTQQAFIFDAIEFCPVNAAAEADKTPLLIQGQSAAALQFWYLPRTADNISGNISKNNPLEKALINKDIKHDIAQQTSAHWTAQEICRLLSTDYASLNNQAIKTENIAILVYSHTQGELIKQVLNHYQLKSVLTSRNSVFDSIEADELYYLLTAVLAPDKETQLKAALATRLIGLSLAELDQLNTDSNRLNHWIQTFENYQKDWQQYSFMMMFRKMCHQQKINQQLYSSDEGERSLTNLLHLAELIQQASDEHPSLEATFNWFAEQINASNNNESRQLRLESDQQLIKIVTIHKSKGLEYDIVFVPFGWKNALRKRSKYLLFHNPRRLSENADFLQNKAKFGEKAQLTGVNEHLDQHGCRKPSPLQEQMAGEPGFNAALEERCIFGQPPRRLSEN
ncbi:MAG: UvrD-helicase domain-containing protein, partial [Methylococcales bacterium]|nr:UvrD-helicase domain-containing protein [Methylococcales bacterium]